MPYAITITGLDSVRRLLGTDYGPAIASATQAIALQVQGEIAPYPPATEANSPGNEAGKWDERGYGSHWRRKDGSVGGSKTSQMLGRQWLIRAQGRTGQAVVNRATYANFVHAAADQARFHARRGWVTDLTAVQRTIASGVARRIVVAAIMGALRRRA